MKTVKMRAVLSVPEDEERLGEIAKVDQFHLRGCTICTGKGTPGAPGTAGVFRFRQNRRDLGPVRVSPGWRVRAQFPSRVHARPNGPFVGMEADSSWREYSGRYLGSSLAMVNELKAMIQQPQPATVTVSTTVTATDGTRPMPGSLQERDHRGQDERQNERNARDQNFAGKVQRRDRTKQHDIAHMFAFGRPRYDALSAGTEALRRLAALVVGRSSGPRGRRAVSRRKPC